VRLSRTTATAFIDHPPHATYPILVMAKKSKALNWFLHRITGTFLVFLLITHFWVQHYDHQVASVTTEVVTEQGALPTYPDEAQEAVRARLGSDAEVTPYDVVMLRLADPVYAVLWKGFNILFLIVALHHGFYGLNNVLSDYIRNDMGRMVAKTLSWSLALVLLVIGMYSVITAGW
jgi:succinate dehydrogenase / fumarate reductase membrane anchor subunit